MYIGTNQNLDDPASDRKAYAKCECGWKSELKQTAAAWEAAIAHADQLHSRKAA